MNPPFRHDSAAPVRRPFEAADITKRSHTASATLGQPPSELLWGLFIRTLRFWCCLSTQPRLRSYSASSAQTEKISTLWRAVFQGRRPQSTPSPAASRTTDSLLRAMGLINRDDFRRADARLSPYFGHCEPVLKLAPTLLLLVDFSSRSTKV